MGKPIVAAIFAGKTDIFQDHLNCIVMIKSVMMRAS